MSKNLKEITGYKVAGLTIDIMSKWRNNEITVQQIEGFLQMTYLEREEKFGRIINPWQEKIESNKKFYKEVLEIDINFTLPIPGASEDFTELLYIPKMKYDTLVKVYQELFGNDYNDGYSKKIDSVLKEQQVRPSIPYWIRHKNGLESDAIHSNKSYDDFFKDGNNYMVPFEAILYALYYRWQIKNMINSLDSPGFHVLFRDHSVLSMNLNDNSYFSDNSAFFLADDLSVGYMPRQVNF